MVPDSWVLRNQLARVYIDEGTPQAALETAQASLTITNSTTHSSDALVLQGVAYHALGEQVKSTQSMDRALDLGLSADSTLLPAEYFLDLGEFERALVILDPYIIGNPGDARGHALRGSAYNGLGRHQKVVLEFEEAFNLDQGTKIDFGRLARSYDELGRISESIQALDIAIGLDPEDAISLAYRGKAYHELGQFELAFNDLNEAIRIKPSQSEPWYLRGLVNLNLGLLEEAARDLEEAIRINPEDPRYHESRGHALNASGQLSQAKEEYARALELDSQVEKVQPQETREDLEAAIPVYPQAYREYYDRGLEFYSLEQFKRAINAYDQAITLNNHVPDFYVSRGLAYHALGLYDLAIGDYDKAIGSKPSGTDPRIFFFSSTAAWPILIWASMTILSPS